MERQQAEMAANKKSNSRYDFNEKVTSMHTDRRRILTPWAPIGGNAPAFGIGPTRGLFVGGGRDPLAVGEQE